MIEIETNQAGERQPPRPPSTGGLTQRQKRAIAALLSEPTVQAAADLADVSRATLYRYLGAPAFQEALSRAQGEVLHMSTARLAGLLSRALDELGDVLDSGRNASARQRAAATVLQHVTGLLEFADLAGRIEVLEQAERKKADGATNQGNAARAGTWGGIAG